MKTSASTSLRARMVTILMRSIPPVVKLYRLLLVGKIFLLPRYNPIRPTDAFTFGNMVLIFVVLGIPLSALLWLCSFVTLATFLILSAVLFAAAPLAALVLCEIDLVTQEQSPHSLE